MPAPALELEPGEQLLALTPASFRGAAASTARATFALGSARLRNTAFHAWCDHVEPAGFPAPGPEMLLALTNRRVLVCAKTFWLGRLARVEGALPLDRIAEIVTVRHGLVMGCAFALTDGHIIEVEAMRARRLRRFARALASAKAGSTG